MPTRSNRTARFVGELLEDRRLLAADLSISEFMAINNATLADEDGDFSDWIEIHNTGDQAASLLGWSLTDSSEQLQKWVFPSASIEPDSYLVVFASSKDRVNLDSNLHTSFKLASGGDYLALVDPDRNVLSEFNPAYPEQSADISYGTGMDGNLHFFEAPTPGAENDDNYADQVAPVQFDVDAGFYTDALTLNLTTTTHDASIKYTTDGSLPTFLNGTQFTGPITISKNSIVRAVGFLEGINASIAETRSYLFVEDVISQSNASARAKGFPSFWFNEQGDYAMDQGIIGPQDAYNGKYAATIRDDLLAVPTMSIVMEMDDLFGNQGIYSNPLDRGPASERPTSVEWIDPSGGDEFQINAGIRIQGGISRSISAKLSMRLLFKSEYGDSTLNFPMFGEGLASQFDSLALRGSGGEGFVGLHYIRDNFIRQTQNDTGNPSPHSRFAHLYLNGLYWGMYEITERPDARFAAEYFGGNKDDYDVLNAGDLGAESVSPVAGDLTAWNRLRSLASRIGRGTTVEARRERFYEIQGLGPDGLDDPKLENYLDVDNYIDYLIVNWYSLNSDWPHRNFYMSRLRGPDSTGFKFFVWDAEFSLFPESASLPTDISEFLGPGIPPDGPAQIFRGLYESEDFRARFSARIAKHFSAGGALYVDSVNSQFDPDNPGFNVPAARYARIVDTVEEPLVAESARWGDNLFGAREDFTVDEVWRQTVDAHMGIYFPTRGEQFLEDMTSFDLYHPAPTFSRPSGSVDTGTPLTISSSDSDGQIFFTTNGTDPRLPNGDLNPQATRFESSSSTQTLIERGSIWNYLDDGSDQAPDWREVGFNDSDWNTGDGEFGYGDGDESTIIDFGFDQDAKHITSYFRHEFQVEDLDSIDGISIDLKRDDGAVVYINGAEVIRTNMPGGQILSSTLADFAISLPEESTYFQFDFPSQVLNEGTNLIAVEVHQANPSSSDVSFDLELAVETLNDVTPIEINENTTIRARVRINNTTWSDLAEARFLTQGVLANSDNIRITEINYHPHAPNPVPGLIEFNLEPDAFEFIEMQNVSNQPVDLFGMRFEDGVVFRFAAQLLDPGEHIVVAKDLAAFASRYGRAIRLADGTGTIVDDGVFAGQLDNNGETIHLLDAVGNSVQRFTYNDAGSWPGRADGKASSLTILDTSANYNDSENWRSSPEFGGSPGRVDADRFESIVISEALANTDGPVLDAIELFNSSNSAVDIGGWYLSDSSSNFFKYKIPQNTSIAANGFMTFDENDFNPTQGANESDFSLSSFGDDVWLLASDARGIPTVFVDHIEFGATLTGKSVGRPSDDIDSPVVMLSETSLNSANSAHRPGELVVSEIQFNPEGDDAGSEFIELLNVSGQTINLADWRLQGNVEFDFGGDQLAPRKSIVLVDFNSNDEVMLESFRTQYSIGNDVTVLGPWKNGDLLSNDRGNLTVQLKNDAIEPGASSFIWIDIDAVQYRTTVGWPTTANGEGDSLQRVEPANFGWLSTSWVGADPTPGSVGDSPEASTGDVNGDNAVDVADVDHLCSSILSFAQSPVLDVNQDGTVNHDDLKFMIERIFGTGPGDSNLDGIFNSKDLVLVFESGEYEDGTVGNSTWAEGDWNCDGEFSSRDLVSAFELGNYSATSIATMQDVAASVDAFFQEH